VRRRLSHKKRSLEPIRSVCVCVRPPPPFNVANETPPTPRREGYLWWSLVVAFNAGVVGGVGGGAGGAGGAGGRGCMSVCLCVCVCVCVRARRFSAHVKTRLAPLFNGVFTSFVVV